MLAKMSLHHLVKHLDAKKKLYDEAGFTEEEIKKDIVSWFLRLKSKKFSQILNHPYRMNNAVLQGTRALVLLDKIHKGDPFVKLEETKDQVRERFELWKITAMGSHFFLTYPLDFMF